MTDTATKPDPPGPPAPQITLPATAAAAVRENALYAARLAQRAAEIRANPGQHKPRLVLSRHVRGESWLDKIADAVNRFCGSMWVFLFISIGIVFWLFAGNIVGFDKTPWPLLLTILNLPQLSIMISLQVSANRAQAASDKRAIADHETLIALHEMARQQLDVLHGQDNVLGLLRDLANQQLDLLQGQEDVLRILNNFASKDLPGRQAEILSDVRRVLAIVGPEPAAG
jgi:uncharacterized membrane protein